MIVLEILIVSQNIIGVSLVRNTLVVDLHELVALSLLLAKLLIVSLIHLLLVFSLLLLLESLNFGHRLIKLGISSLLDQISIGLVWLTLLALNQLEWIAAFWDIVAIVIVVEVDLNILGLNQVMIHVLD